MLVASPGDVGEQKQHYLHAHENQPVSAAQSHAAHTTNVSPVGGADQ
jgi:hypothetical protein